MSLQELYEMREFYKRESLVKNIKQNALKVLLNSLE